MRGCLSSYLLALFKAWFPLNNVFYQHVRADRVLKLKYTSCLFENGDNKNTFIDRKDVIFLFSFDTVINQKQSPHKVRSLLVTVSDCVSDSNCVTVMSQNFVMSQGYIYIYMCTCMKYIEGTQSFMKMVFICFFI